MKRILLLFSIAYWSVAIATTPQSVRYAYDNAGNRISREISITVAGDEPQERIASVSESLASKEIRIYPNPTDGILSIRIENYENSDDASFVLYDMSGAIVDNCKAEEQTSTIDISNCQSGIYILLIEINGEQSSWRILKK